MNTAMGLISKIKELQKVHGNDVAVKIDGVGVTSIEFVPAEGGFPGYIDIVGL